MSSHVSRPLTPSEKPNRVFSTLAGEGTRKSMYESTDEIIGLAEGLGYCKKQRHSFDDSQENELQLCLHGALDTNLGSLDF